MELDCRPFLDAGSSGSKMEQILQLYARRTPISSDNYPLWEGIFLAPYAGFMHFFGYPLPLLLEMAYTREKSSESYVYLRIQKHT